MFCQRAWFVFLVLYVTFQATSSFESYLTATFTNDSKEKLLRWMGEGALTSVSIYPTYSRDLGLPPEADLCGKNGTSAHLEGMSTAQVRT